MLNAQSCRSVVCQNRKSGDCNEDFWSSCWIRCDGNIHFIKGLTIADLISSWGETFKAFRFGPSQFTFYTDWNTRVGPPGNIFKWLKSYFKDEILLVHLRTMIKKAWPWVLFRPLLFNQHTPPRGLILCNDDIAQQSRSLIKWLRSNRVTKQMCRSIKLSSN